MYGNTSNGYAPHPHPQQQQPQQPQQPQHHQQYPGGAPPPPPQHHQHQHQQNHQHQQHMQHGGGDKLVDEVTRVRHHNERLQEHNALLQADMERLRAQLQHATSQLQLRTEEVQQLHAALQTERASVDMRIKHVAEHARAAHSDLLSQGGDIPLLEQHLHQAEQQRLHLESSLRDAVAREHRMSDEINRLTDAEKHRVEYIENLKRTFEAERAVMDHELANEQGANRRDRLLREEAEARAAHAENQLRFLTDAMSVRSATDAVDANARQAETARLEELVRQHAVVGELLARAEEGWSDMERSWVSTLAPDGPTTSQHHLHHHQQQHHHHHHHAAPMHPPPPQQYLQAQPYGVASAYPSTTGGAYGVPHAMHAGGVPPVATYAPPVPHHSAAAAYYQQ